MIIQGYFGLFVEAILISNPQHDFYGELTKIIIQLLSNIITYMYTYLFFWNRILQLQSVSAEEIRWVFDDI